MNRRENGFTLIELLVACGLCIMLVTVVCVVFFRSTDVVLNSQARIAIVSNARAAMDLLEADLKNAWPTAPGDQRFHALDAGESMGADHDVRGAKDYLGFVTSATVSTPGGQRVTKRVFVEWYLLDEPDFELGAGNPTSASVRSSRTMRAWTRRTWTVSDSKALGAYLAGMPAGPVPPSAAAGAGLTEMEEAPLCHYVASANVELCGRDGYYEVHAFGANPWPASAMPIGDVAGEGLPRRIRVTLRLIEGAAERAERVMQREFWLPVE
jgi:type II secretory pathway pseudopilin PulG